MGKSLVEEDPSASITVVPHNYWAPHQPQSDHSLLHAAETISNHLNTEMEDAVYSDFVPQSTMTDVAYTSAVDPAFLVETGSQERSIEHSLEEEIALEDAERRAREHSEEMDIGLIEESAALVQPTIVVTPIAVAQPPPPARPTWISPVYAEVRPAAPVRRPPPPPAVAYQAPEYRDAPEPHPRVLAARARHAARKARRAARKARKATQWSVASIIPSGSVKSTPPPPPKAQPFRPKKQYITPAVKPDQPKPRRIRRRCIKRDQSSRKCVQRCRRCSLAPPKPQPKPIQYFSPSFYPPKPKKQRPQPPRPDERILVNTPNGPVYVLYVSRRKGAKPASTPAASGPVPQPQSAPQPPAPATAPVEPNPNLPLPIPAEAMRQYALQQLAFNQAPRAFARGAPSGATYLLPNAPISPYALQAAARQSAQTALRARRLARAQVQIARRRAAALAARRARQAKRAARHAARRQAKSAAKRLRKQQIQNMEYDPTTNTIIRHIHNHHFERAPKPAPSVPTLERAYLKLCRLQKAIVRQYNRGARHDAWRAKVAARREAVKAARAAAAAGVLNRVEGFEHDSNTAEADALRKKYSSHLKRYKRAKKLIARAQAFLADRKAKRAHQHAARVHCMLKGHQDGKPVPSCAPRRRRRASSSRKVTRRSRVAAAKARRAAFYASKRKCRRASKRAGLPIPAKCAHRTPAQRKASLKKRLAKIRAAKKRCRSLARQAGVPIPQKCLSTRMTRKVFNKKRYNPKTNRVRFAQTESESDAESENAPPAPAARASDPLAAAKAARPDAFKPVDGLDYNQSPLIQNLLAQLKAKNIL